MLAKSPLAQNWHDDAPYFSRYVENDVTLAIVDRSCGRWMARITQAVVPHKSISARTVLGGPSGYDSLLACKLATEDFVDLVRNGKPPASSDGAALGREALASGPLPHDDFHGFQSFVGY